MSNDSSLAISFAWSCQISNTYQWEREEFYLLLPLDVCVLGIFALKKALDDLAKQVR